MKIADVKGSVPAELLRYVKVDPSEFKALRDELGLSNKECAAAISRTLARVSELTNSKGASMEVYERVSTQWREFAATKAK